MVEEQTSSGSERVVEAQLDAYNNRNIEAFMRCWHRDAEYLAYPNEVLASGLGAIKERHLQRFKDDALNGKLLHRAVVEDMVVDHELVTRTFPEGISQVDVIAIYLIEDALIRKAWFKQSAPRLLNSA